MCVINSSRPRVESKSSPQTLERNGTSKNLHSDGLLDKFETRYIIFDTSKINFENFNELLYWANVFEVEWLKLISNRYNLLFNKDINRIKMIEERIYNNK